VVSERFGIGRELGLVSVYIVISLRIRPDNRISYIDGDFIRGKYITGYTHSMGCLALGDKMDNREQA
jgi:hypothetical protein